MKKKLEALLVEYGKLAVVVYLALFVLSLAGFSIAIAAGVEVESAAGQAGTLGAAYLATKLLQPVRIGATLVLTPIIGKLLKLNGRRPPPEPPA